MTPVTVNPTNPNGAAARPPQVLTDLLVQNSRALAAHRLRELEPLMAECAARGLSFEQFIGELRTTLLPRHAYHTATGDSLAYDAPLLMHDLTVTHRDITAMYREARNTTRPRTAAEVAADRLDAERFNAVQARRASMPPVVQSTFDPLTDVERAHAKRASAATKRHGHQVGWFRHVQGPSPLLAAYCAACGRWASVDAKTSELSGSAVQEHCSR